DWLAAVTVNGTGLLDLNNRSDAVGQANGQTALTINSGVVQSGTGTLTVNGDIVFNGSVVAGTLPGNNNVILAPVLSGTLNLGGTYARTITANDRGELLVDAILSANITGAADVLKGSTGELLLSGTNSGMTGKWSI